MAVSTCTEGEASRRTPLPQNHRRDILARGKALYMTTPYHPPVKRSIEIAGHKTSISLEPFFWDRLKAAAANRGLPISALVACIDAERIAVANPPGLAGAVRLWLAAHEP